MPRRPSIQHAAPLGHFALCHNLPPHFAGVAPCSHFYCGGCLRFLLDAIKAAQCTALFTCGIVSYEIDYEATPTQETAHTRAPAPTIGDTESSGGASASTTSRRSTGISNCSRAISRAAVINDQIENKFPSNRTHSVEMIILGVARVHNLTNGITSRRIIQIISCTKL